jgi:asparagine synthase (glutamine-hydrolysing)
MYALAIWHSDRQELLLVRDRLGVKPLYYYPLPDRAGVLFGSEPKAILANPLARPQITAEGFAEMLSLASTPGHGVFRGMYAVRPGHIVTVSQAGIRQEPYWRLEARPHTDDLRVTVAHVRELLEDIVDRQLVSDVPLASLLSGGLDSSVLVALALRSAGNLSTFSVNFTGATDDFRTDSLRTELDETYVHKVAAHLGTRHRTVELGAADLMHPRVRTEVLRARDSPASFGDIDSSLHLLLRGTREHATVALSGESADEVFGGYPWIHDPDAIKRDQFPWLSRLALIPENLLTEQFRRDSRFVEYRADAYHQAVAETPRLAGDCAAERRMREISYLHLTRWLPVLLDRKDRLSMAVGLEVRVPYCDHRLVEYVFNVPWAMRTFDGREKSLLRAAAAGLLPQSVLTRRKGPYPTTNDPAYETQLREQAHELLSLADSPALNIVDAARLRDLLRNPFGEFSSWLDRNPLEIALLLAQWFDDYRVELV